MEAPIRAMLALQDEINTQIHPDWRSQEYPWYRAIWVECAELLDHYGWKWWKHQEPDVAQVRLELVDIWHFGLSDLLVRGVPAARIAVGLCPPVADHETRGNTFCDWVERFAGNTLQAREFDLAGFATLLRAGDLGFEELYRSYVGKNVLNRFRQDRGYRQGTYRKHWRGREDNEWLVTLSDGLNPDSEAYADDLYAALARAYQAEPDG